MGIPSRIQVHRESTYNPRVQNLVITLHYVPEFLDFEPRVFMLGKHCWQNSLYNGEIFLGLGVLELAKII